MDVATTVLFYTANLKPEPFASNVRQVLLEAIGDLPLISISHKPLDYGYNICLGTCRVSAYTLYQQVLIGARAANTKYIACAEDDAAYTSEHFAFRPLQDDTFYFNSNRWWVEERGVYRWRDRTVLSTCICSRELFIGWAERLFAKFPIHPDTRDELTGFAEPSRYEKYLGLPQVKGDTFYTKDPVLTFNSKPSLGGRRSESSSDRIAIELYPWGRADALWTRFHGTDSNGLGNHQD